MSEIERMVWVHITFTEPPPEGGATVQTQLFRHAGGDAWTLAGNRQVKGIGVGAGRFGGFLISSGLYALQFRVFDPPTLEGFVILVRLEIDDPVASYDLGAVTIGQEFSNKYVIYLSDDAPYITVGSTIPTYIPPPVTDPSVIVAPDVPFWLKPFTDFFGAIGGGLINSLLGVGNGLLGVLNPLSDFFRDPYGSLIGNLRSIINKGSGDYTDVNIQTLLDMASGSPEWSNVLVQNTDPLTKFFMGKIPDYMDINLYAPEEATVEAIVNSTYNMASELMRLSISASMTGAGFEIASLGQVEGVGKVFDVVINQFGITDIVKQVNILPMQKGLLTPFEHAVNSAYPNELPTNADLINMVVKEKITLNVFKANMLKQGLNAEWSQLIWDAHFIAPDYNNVRMAYHRGNITEEQLLPMLKRVDFDPEFNEQIWLPNLWTIPPYTDLINMRVKEVISSDVFAQNLRTHGYDPIWGQRLWDAHFFPPTQGDIITAYRRRIPVSIPEFDEETGALAIREVEQLTLDDVHKLMVLVDLDPRYTSIFDTRLYNDPTIRQARYMFETGAISGDIVQDIVRRSGLSPEYIEPMTEYLTEFTEREYRRRYLTALQGGVMSGVYTPDDLTEAVTEAGFPEGVAKWMLMTAEVRMKVAEAPKALAKPKLLSISDLKKAYLKDFIDDPTLRLHLDALGYEFNDIALLVQILDDAKVTEEEGRRQVVLTSSQLINAFRYGKMSESDLRDRLMLKGLALDEAQLIIDTKKAQWGVGGEA